MCGLVGLLKTSETGEFFGAETLQTMARTLHHRGPDDFGEWCDQEAGISLAHRRLSILDLSTAGHQPMSSSSGRFVLVFNGEIYNHEQLRSELDRLRAGSFESQAGRSGSPWRGHSDTETLLNAFEQWGITAALSRAVGMFAIAVWDRQSRVLTLARDRLGEKPLYYGWVGQAGDTAFAFGSELKALRAFSGFDNRICRTALGQYMQFSMVPAPRTIYQGIFKLEAGCMLVIQQRAPAEAPLVPLRPGQCLDRLEIRRWWSLSDVAARGASAPCLQEPEAVEELRASLTEAVRSQSIADVPLGAFLSGGVDSALIVSLLQRSTSFPVKTFTVGFEEAEFDETPYAAAVAKHIGTDHTEVRVTPRETQAVIERLPHVYDEPFADSSQIPTYLVCQAARKRVTVALSGDAGDELFGGYTRYQSSAKLWRRISAMPFSMRRAIGTAVKLVPQRGWDGMGWIDSRVRRRPYGVSMFGDRIRRLGDRLESIRSLDDLSMSQISTWRNAVDVVKYCKLESNQSTYALNDPLPSQGVSEHELEMMYRDSMMYLPDDILCKVDRAAMASSLETRIPFLDHRVVELAWRLPLSLKIRGGIGKWVVKELLNDYIPRELMDRPKTGFSIPIGEWLRGPLRDWAEALLDAGRLEREGFFHPRPIREAWLAHLAGLTDATAQIWTVLMFQAWHETQTRPASV